MIWSFSTAFINLLQERKALFRASAPHGQESPSKLGASRSNFCSSAAAVAFVSPALSFTFHLGERLVSGDLEEELSKDRLTFCSLLGPACPNMSLFLSPVPLEVNSLPLLGTTVT